VLWLSSRAQNELKLCLDGETSEGRFMRRVLTHSHQGVLKVGPFSYILLLLLNKREGNGFTVLGVPAILLNMAAKTAGTTKQSSS
jgi:hypothetical protein